ncbi:MAG: nucleotidyl transferase AbiEii/AbiGii toxin family protein [Betaproteobacteria bacterium]|nr:nucleotidyl transferase AbiEii/AbiGii toxin family protein [Betaproteobacteria bacterium]
MTLAVLRAIAETTHGLGLPYFVAGAMARDILLTNVFGIDTGRATRDVDFAVAVEDWDQFEIVKEKLTASGQFTPAEKAAHRLYYRAHGGETGYPVDILPFRGVERPSHVIAWPPDMQVIMNVVGYEDVLAAAVAVTVESDLSVPIASLPGLALLKLFAWDDRRAETPKDAQDLVILLRRYHMAGNQGRLYGNESAVLEAVDFDLDTASPRLLGMDVRRMTSPLVLEQALILLSNSNRRDRLVTDMAKQLQAVDDSIAEAENCFEQFEIGLTTGVAKR